MTRQSWLAHQTWTCHDCTTEVDSATAYYLSGNPGFYCETHWRERAGREA